jgi:hypothetical protein
MSLLVGSQYPLLLISAASAPTGPAPDLMAAVMAQLRAYSGGSVATAFGDTGLLGPSSGVKFQSDNPQNQTVPYLSFDEPVAKRQYESGGRWVEKGYYDCHVYAENKVQAKSLRDMVGTALNDAPLVFAGATLMYFRWSDDTIFPSGETGVAVAVEREAIARFIYISYGPT